MLREGKKSIKKKTETKNLPNIMKYHNLDKDPEARRGGGKDKTLIQAIMQYHAPLPPGPDRTS
jgi:hypothetical protein